MFWSFGLHHQWSGTASFGCCRLAFHSETWLAGAVSSSHIAPSGKDKTIKGKEEVMLSNAKSQQRESNVHKLIACLMMGVVMVSLVGSAAGGSFT